MADRPEMVRTTILLDDGARRAARQAAAILDVSPSEAIRRAIVHYRDELAGATAPARRRRRAAFDRLCRLFGGHDARAEAARIRSERDRWR